MNAPANLHINKRQCRTTVFRVPKTGTKFVRISNSAMQDKRLSFRARGVLAYVLSMPDDWRHSSRRMAEIGNEGRDAVQAALNELRALGYCEFLRENSPQGKFSTTIIFHEKPKPDFQASAEDTAEAGFTGAGKSETGKTEAGKTGFNQTTIEKRLSDTNDSHTQESVLALWASLCPNLPRPGELTSTRRYAIAQRLREANGNIEAFKNVFARVGDSEFLNGGGHSGWKASFDWVLNPENWAKILEGNYSNHSVGAMRKLTAEDYAKGF